MHASSDADAPFLDLIASVFIDIVFAKIYEKRDVL